MCKVLVQYSHVGFVRAEKTIRRKIVQQGNDSYIEKGNSYIENTGYSIREIGSGRERHALALLYIGLKASSSSPLPTIAELRRGRGTSAPSWLAGSEHFGHENEYTFEAAPQYLSIDFVIF